jgi:DNA polymerase-3 subunit epsilon
MKLHGIKYRYGGIRLKYCAIDFETANRFTRISASSVAIVVFENSNIVYEYNQLIRPPNNYHHKDNINLTGITPEMTQKAPLFVQIFPEIAKILSGSTIVAHNAVFDKSVMCECIKYYGIANDYGLCENNNWVCTKNIYKKLGYKNTKLNELALHYNIKLNHHDALSDARCCGALYDIFLNKKT